MYHHDDSNLKLKLCFILGISPRSGTNYIYNLLKEHPDCISPGPIWEDFLVSHSEMLKNYTKAVYRSYPPEWKIEKKIGSEVLMQNLGSSLRQFLKIHLTQHIANQTNLTQAPYSQKPKILFTKTPSVSGLANFFDLFPDDYLIIIIRDGRAVVESGVRSFGWKYEYAMREWAINAKIILDFKERYQHSGKKLLIVKYEDLFRNERDELLKILTFLDLDPNLFNFENIRNLGVVGSSEIRIKNPGAELHWQPTGKTSAFNPLARFNHWNRKKHRRFNWIAGRYMSEFGYDLKPVRSSKYLNIIQNKLLDYLGSLIFKTYKAYAKHLVLEKNPPIK